MQLWIVYMVRCSDDSLYTGITRSLVRRMREHTSGRGSKYVRARQPFTLVYTENVNSHSDALKREYAIKQMSKLDKEWLVNDARLGIQDPQEDRP